MTCRRALISALAGFLLSSPTWAAPAGKPVIAVKTFENPGTDSASTIGSGLTDIFITELQKTGRFKIIERAAVGELMDEVDFGASGYVNQATAVKKGNIEGIEYWFIGKVTNFGVEEKVVGGAGAAFIPFLGGFAARKKRTTVRLDYRIVDAATGEAITADFGEGEVKKGGVVVAGIGPGFGGVGGARSSEFLGSAMGKATLQAIEQIIGKLNITFSDYGAMTEDRRQQVMASVEGKVLAVVGTEVILDLGSASTARVGDTLTLIRQTPVKDSKGNVVFNDEASIGEVTVTQVQGARVRAAVRAGGRLPPAEGDLARSAVAAAPSGG